MSEPRLIFTGNVIVDLVMNVTTMPEAGGDTVAQNSDITAGGGLNTMVAARRDGLPVVFAGQYGSGHFGGIVRAALNSGGFEILLPGLDDRDSGYCVAIVDASTERTFVTVVGAEGHLTLDDLRHADTTSDDLVYVSGYSLAHPVNAASLPIWLEELPAETRVITDPSPLVTELDPALMARVFARTDFLSANEREAGLLAPGTDARGAADTLRSRIRPGGTVIVREGALGCWVATGDAEPVLVPGFAVEAVDSNGAGDAHGGVLAAGLARGLDPVSAARRANAAAAIAVTRRGPATAPEAAEIDAFLAAR
ncbi:PfkB family carbohydrate kinase [Mycetocola saprophilus]|uniref:PfkB family carbohydrate kinase n=1 Tax=Mycetocola saprophilus TaxID=76636 RepID=UPI003BF254AC